MVVVLVVVVVVLLLLLLLLLRKLGLGLVLVLVLALVLVVVGPRRRPLKRRDHVVPVWPREFHEPGCCVLVVVTLVFSPIISTSQLCIEYVSITMAVRELDLLTSQEAEAGPVESLGVSVRVRTRGRKIQGLTTSFDH